MFRVTHKCLLAPHKSPNTVFLVQLEGQKLALLLEGLQFCTLRQKVSTESVFSIFQKHFTQMKVCEAAGLAVPGVWPLMFPGNGYHGQINWLASLVGCIGQKAYSAVLSAAKEGEVNLTVIT